MFVKMTSLILVVASTSAWGQDAQVLSGTASCLGEGLSWGQIAALKELHFSEEQAAEQLKAMSVAGDPVLDAAKLEGSVRAFYSGTERDPRVQAGDKVKACMALRAASLANEKVAPCFVNVYESQRVFGALANGSDLEGVNAAIEMRRKAGWLSDSAATALKGVADANKNKGLDGARFELVTFVRCIR